MKTKFEAVFFYNDDEGVCLCETTEIVYAEDRGEAFNIFDELLGWRNADDYELIDG